MSTQYNMQSKHPIYNNFQYDSELEANWAVFWNEIGFAYIPHPYSFKTGIMSGGNELVYTPDFYLNDFNVYCEAKPSSAYLDNPEIQRKISAAMTNNCTPVGHGLVILGPLSGYRNDSKKMSLSGEYYEWCAGFILKSSWIIGEWDGEIEIRCQESDYSDNRFAKYPRFSNNPSVDVAVHYHTEYGSETIYKAFFHAIYADRNGDFKY